MQRLLTFSTLALIAGCTCDEPVVGFDAQETTPDAPLDAGRDAALDAYTSADAFVPLALTEIDPSPCPTLTPPPRRARALPADSTPRILWTRSVRALGIDEGYPDVGAIDRNGDLHFSVPLLEIRGAEVSGEGALLGFGFGFDRTKAAWGPMMIFPNDHGGEWSGDTIRIDASPPSLGSFQGVAWPNGSGADMRSISVGLAATSDGFYAYRGSSGGRLRKYCMDGRLQWELAGVTSANIRIDVDDSVWLAGPQDTTQRVDKYGAVVETVRGTVQFAGDDRWVTTLSSDERTFTNIRFVDGIETDRFVSEFAQGGVSPDPTGGYSRLLGDPPRSVRFVGGVEVSSIPADGSGGVFGSYGEDGSTIRFRTTDPPSLSRRMPNGSLVWELEFPTPFRSITHDIDGRVYLYGLDTIIAVQTDVLPPNVRGCWQHRCNALANMSIAPYPG